MTGNATQVPFAQEAEAGEAIWFFGEFMTVLVPGEATGDRCAIVEHQARRGQASPWHRQLEDDEMFTYWRAI